MVGQAVSGHLGLPVDFPWGFGGHFDRGEPVPAQGPLRDSLPLSQEKHRSNPKTLPFGQC